MGRRENGHQVSGRFPSLDSKLILFDADNGDVLALMDADWITTMRTGAVAAGSIEVLGKKRLSNHLYRGFGQYGARCIARLA